MEPAEESSTEFEASEEQTAFAFVEPEPVPQEVSLQAAPFLPLAAEHVIVETLVTRIVALVVTVGAAIALGAAWFAGEMARGWWVALLISALALVVGLLVLAQRWPPTEHRHAGYRVGPDTLDIKKGVIWRSIASVPRARIQHTDVAQGPLQRSYGLATLVIYTAGTSYSKLELAGLPHEEALRIRDELLVAGDAHGH